MLSILIDCAIMDTIFLEQVKVKTHLGVPKWERLKAQTVILDIEIGYDLSKACKSDDVADTIDYGAVVHRIRETLTENSFQLVETLGEHICQLILQEFKALTVSITVSKPAILPNLKALGIRITRKRA